MANHALITRRTLAATLAAVPAAGVAGPVTGGASSSADAELLALCERWKAALAAANAPGDRPDEEQNRLAARMFELEFEIAERPATTIAGLRAKASVTRHFFENCIGASEDGALGSLLDDINRIAGMEAAHV